MEPVNRHFFCPHDIKEPQEAEVYQVPVCEMDFRFDYRLIQECYLPDHDCTFNMVGKLNICVGKRDVVSDERTKRLDKEAEEYGRKKVKLDPELSTKLCSLAQAMKFVEEQNNELTEAVQKAAVLDGK